MTQRGHPCGHSHSHGHSCCAGDGHGPTVRGFLIPYLLHLLERGSSHGYQLIDLIKDGSYLSESPDPGVVYRHLRKMEQEGMVTSAFEQGGGPARKVYSITEEGERCLSDWIHHLRSAVSRLQKFLDMVDSTVVPKSEEMKK